MKKTCLLFTAVFIALLFSGCFSGLLSFNKFRLYNDHAELTSCSLNSSSFVVPDTYKGKPVTVIGDHAFSGCLFTRKIQLPDGITEIGKQAFFGCTDLENVNIPESVTSIDDEAFSQCESLHTISISKNVSHIGEMAFDGCTSLKDIRLASDNPSFTLVDGVLYTKDKTTLIFYPAVLTADTYTIPGGVTTIRGGAFYGNPNLKTIHMPEGLTQIGDSAFQDCVHLNTITVPNSVLHIGDGAFDNTDWLQNQKQKFVIINHRFLVAYNGSEMELTIPEGVTSISLSNTDGWNTARVLSISKTVTDISPGVLNLDIDIFKVESGNAVYASEDTMLYNHDKTTLIRYPLTSEESSYTVAPNVKTIGKGAFMSGYHLQSVTLPDGLEHIGANAFNGCSALTEIHLSNGLKDIGDEAFSGCRDLPSLVLPGTVTSIGENVFSGCDEMKSITIPPSVTSIGKGTFADCPKLTIYGKDKSFAQSYAHELQIPFKSQ